MSSSSLSVSATSPAHLILFPLIILAKTTNFEEPRYAAFFNITPSLFGPNIILNTSTQTPSVYIVF
jgi:hypothetical protein